MIICLVLKNPSEHFFEHQILYMVWYSGYYYCRTKTFVKITFLRSSQSHFTKEHIKAGFQFYWKHKDFLSNVTNTFLEYYYGFLPPLSSW